MKSAAILLASALLAGPAFAADPRPARCAIESAYAGAWRGPCLFLPEGRGSFTIMPARGGAFPDGLRSISLHVVAPGVGEVRGLTAEGVSSRWGQARRSARQRACWRGSDFGICVY